MLATLIICCTVIAIASLIDCVVSLRTRLQPVDEENPLAKWVLTKFGLNGLVACKVGGTVLCLGLLAAVWQISPAIALMVAVPVALAMAGTVTYLWWYS